MEVDDEILSASQENLDEGSARFTDEIHEGYEESSVGETNSKLLYEVNKNRLEENIPNPIENGDAAIENDEDQSEKSDVIKMLFKGTFEENSREVLKNLNKFSRIEFDISDANVPEVNFSTLESQNCVEKSTLETLVEETGSIVKESVVSKEDVLEEDVDIALEMENTWSYMFRAVNLMLLAVLAVCFTMIPIVRFALDILLYITPVRGSVPVMLLTMIDMFIR